MSPSNLAKHTKSFIDFTSFIVLFSTTLNPLIVSIRKRYVSALDTSSKQLNLCSRFSCFSITRISFKTAEAVG